MLANIFYFAIEYFSFTICVMDLKRAAEIQQKLSEDLILEWDCRDVQTIAGADFSYDKLRNKIGAQILVFKVPEFEIMDKAEDVRTVRFPYIPGFLTLREGPAFLAAFRKLRKEPDITLVDGNGIAHPRKMGLASWVGVLLDICTVGCAKNPFFPFTMPDPERGSTTPFRTKKGEVAGACVRTRDRVKPVFVSPGHRIDIETSVEWVLRCSRLRIPEPLREAHKQARSLFD